MKNPLRGRLRKIGLPPGSLVYLGDPQDKPIELTIFDYDHHFLEEKRLTSIEESYYARESSSISWINVDGIHDSDLVNNICNHFNIHSLTIEDILSVGQRPKVENLDNYIFMVMNMLTFDDINEEVVAEQVSLIVSDHTVISFQEHKGDVFESIRNRIRSGMGRIRKGGADYLFYSIIDNIVDYYFIILEKLGDKIEEVEDEIVENPTNELLNRLHHLKKQVLILRRSIWPLREVINRLERKEFKQIDKKIRIYFRDVYDHTIQIIDTVESYRDALSSLADLHQSMSGNRMNEVMKVLTIISTIFIPLTFITGLYGMNFQYMPELQWRYGYYMVWGFMFVMVITMLIVFKKRKWW